MKSRVRVRRAEFCQPTAGIMIAFPARQLAKKDSRRWALDCEAAPSANLTVTLAANCQNARASSTVTGFQRNVTRDRDGIIRVRSIVCRGER